MFSIMLAASGGRNHNSLDALRPRKVPRRAAENVRRAQTALRSDYAATEEHAITGTRERAKIGGKHLRYGANFAFFAARQTVQQQLKHLFRDDFGGPV